MLFTTMSSWWESKGYRFSFFDFADCLADRGAGGALGAVVWGTGRLAGAHLLGCVIVAGARAGSGCCCGYGDEDVADGGY